ncbi:uncharacterized protein BYT42DRAFT_494938 [Radiomyces spectabilis]|uniref:uncharacterized protein n=1 Tax=Radiomyces spectabilis TaxID=64574 RepID=UPI00222081CD|nr:uncharacterized protein BYT42DRAFT_494938 [Radiomyces spectabilis]KAI8381177.1 hypothetical protein BYT42DRAFT_494938 [Radiomyces spectabilis]
MAKNLENVHHHLMEVAKESQRLSHKKYTADDVRMLQEKLADIDAKYKNGVYDDVDKSMQADVYETEGQAQVADELERIHQTLHVMLTRIDTYN